MGRQASLMATLEIMDRDEFRELQAAAKERVEKLEKYQKNMEKAELHAAARDIGSTLRIWKGVDGAEGLLSRIDEQRSFYDPAFSDNGKEPKGQREIFEGVDRGSAPTPAAEEKEEPKVVDLHALKAALILTEAAAKAGPEAFDKLDVDLEEEKRIVYLGRASMDLLHEMSPTDAAALYELAIDLVHRTAEPTEQDVQDLVALATKIALDGATLAPFYEPFPVSEDGSAWPGSALQWDLNAFDEEDWSECTREQLQEIVLEAELPRAKHLLTLLVSERAAHAIDIEELRDLGFDQVGKLINYSARHFLASRNHDVDVPERPAILDELEAKWGAVDPPAYQPTAAEKVQEEVLTHKPVSDSFFKDTLHHATKWALERALEIIQGTPNNKTREEKIRRRLEELKPEERTPWTVRRLEEPREVETYNGEKGPFQLTHVVEKGDAELGFYRSEEEANEAAGRINDRINGIPREQPKPASPEEPTPAPDSVLEKDDDDLLSDS